MSIELDKAQLAQNKAADMLKKNVFLQQQRPAFHFASPVGWINDPNGFSFYKGKCHLFYQFHPYTTKWGPMHWGHAITDDFVIWNNEPVAMAPDTAADKDGCFSGTAVEVDGKQILAYTGVTEGGNVQSQCIAIGDGKTYKKLDVNPVITSNQIPFEFDNAHFRDPKIWFNNGTYYLVAVIKTKDGSGALVSFESKDLRKWNFSCVIDSSECQLGMMWECPDFFDMDGKKVFILSPQQMLYDEQTGFHNGNNSVYITGECDKQTGILVRDTRPENLKTAAELDYGIDFYAPETTLTPDGRRILIAWMHNWDSFSTPESYYWTGQMTIPRELTFKKNILRQSPVRELEKYRSNAVKGSVEASTSNLEFEVKGIEGRQCDLLITIHNAENATGSLKIQFAKGDKYFTQLEYDAEKKAFTFDRTYCGYGRDTVAVRKMNIVPEENGDVSFRCILDTCSLEVFACDGRYAFTNTFYTPCEFSKIQFSTTLSTKFDYESYKLSFPKE